MPRTLTIAEIKRFYDRFGRLQDGQVFYEGRALSLLEQNGNFEQARHVVEFGSGTGSFARRLLKNRLPSDATYLALDVSENMVRIARGRLKPWPERAEVRLTSGETRLPVEDSAVDRVIANYVLDLMSEESIRAFIGEAFRALSPGGLLCLASLTHGESASARTVASLWARIQERNPAQTGGCRPITIEDYVEPDSWRTIRREIVTQCCVSSEVLILCPRKPETSDLHGGDFHRGA